jgi:hypothetical protein
MIMVHNLIFSFSSHVLRIHSTIRGNNTKEQNNVKKDIHVVDYWQLYAAINRQIFGIIQYTMANCWNTNSKHLCKLLKQNNNETVNICVSC